MGYRRSDVPFNQMRPRTVKLQAHITVSRRFTLQWPNEMHNLSLDIKKNSAIITVTKWCLHKHKLAKKIAKNVILRSQTAIELRPGDKAILLQYKKRCVIVENLGGRHLDIFFFSETQAKRLTKMITHLFL